MVIWHTEYGQKYDFDWYYYIQIWLNIICANIFVYYHAFLLGMENHMNAGKWKVSAEYTSERIISKYWLKKLECF